MKQFSLKIILLILTIPILFMGCSTDVTNDEPGKEITLLLEPQEGNPRNSEGDFIKLKDGRLLFVYTHFTGGTGDHASAYLAGRYSNDNGKTWTKEDITVISNEGSMNIMSVSLLRLENGKIALFYLRKNSETDCIPFMRTSTDEAKSWSEPVRCMDTEGYHVVNNDRFVQLGNGRIIFPTSLHNINQPKLSAIGIVNCYYSDDNGRSWIKSQQVANPENIVLQEPGVVELKNGKLLLFCRTESGVQYFSFSDDQGITWTPIKPGNIRSPLSPASIERIPSTGDLLLVWNNNFETGRDGGKRTPFNLAISKDEGETWQKIKTIESDPAGWYCYTAIEFTGKHVLLGHCAGDTRINNGLSTTQITRLSLDWIYKDATANPFVESDSSGNAMLACNAKNAQIFYTLDGSLPTPSTGQVFQDPIIVTHPVSLFMQAFEPGKTPSKIVSAKVGTNVLLQAIQLEADPQQGLVYKYFEGQINTTESIEDISFIKSGITQNISIENSPQSTNFAYIFEGFIKVPKEGKYTFYLESNDGSVLWLDGYKLIDNDGAHGAYERSASTSLHVGMHKIKVKYFQLGGASLLNVLWDGPEISKEEIPEGFLFHKLDD
ncbi:MAG: exo-alpha-sialidase [Bacteroidales bacterium]|nr:exo-alpha-sialidase [Bacteroidales bacterium]